MIDVFYTNKVANKYNKIKLPIILKFTGGLLNVDLTSTKELRKLR